MGKRVFLIVMDSVGIGELPDSEKYGDKGCNTLKSCWDTGDLKVPHLQKLGLFNIDGIDYGNKVSSPLASYARLAESSDGKDTTIGHWEIAGIISTKPLPTYPNGYPDDLVQDIEMLWGKKMLCNKPYSGTKVLEDYGTEHMETGKPIVYTSGDSVFQIAAHEDVICVDHLYTICEIARKLLCEEHNVGRVIARPFVGEYPHFKRTANRRDFSLQPPKATILDELKRQGLRTIGVGKIYDIFAGKGVDQKVKTKSNDEGMQRTIELVKKDFSGICFVNLVDFDMVYGHRNDVQGYTQALNDFDNQLGILLTELKEDDVLIITADHGCDPGRGGTDHTREYVPMIMYGNRVKRGVNLGTRTTFSDIAATIEEYFKLSAGIDGQSFAKGSLDISDRQDIVENKQI